MVRTNTKFPEQVEGAKEVLQAKAAVIAVTVAETQQLQNIHLKGK